MVRKKQPENVQLGSLLRQYRIRHGETQAELGEAVGRSRTVIQDYETGKVAVPFDVREKLALRYGMPDSALGLALPNVGPDAATGPHDAAKALALYTLKTVEDPEARRLALEYIESLIAVKI